MRDVLEKREEKRHFFFPSGGKQPRWEQTSYKRDFPVKQGKRLCPCRSNGAVHIFSCLLQFAPDKSSLISRFTEKVLVMSIVSLASLVA